ncbi:hypothetical protein NDU88_007859 [Pleurodeles waltl]|uniref:Uncharacterized protein n=1 Tax=Pleurodeles waltl TaxID=8319 RepID=A0AAV7RS59_PLEWA|nr:hypothetical protein NDU88_007859 [Pleurodeles waltl]
MSPPLCDVHTRKAPAQNSQQQKECTAVRACPAGTPSPDAVSVYSCCSYSSQRPVSAVHQHRGGSGYISHRT